MGLRAWKSSAAILLLFVCGTQFIATAQPATQRKRKPPVATRELVAQVRKSLVVVLTQDHEGNVIAQGSGFFFKPGVSRTRKNAASDSRRSSRFKPGKWTSTMRVFT